MSAHADQGCVAVPLRFLGMIHKHLNLRYVLFGCTHTCTGSNAG